MVRYKESWLVPHSKLPEALIHHVAAMDDDVRDTVHVGLLLERSSVVLDPIESGVNTGQFASSIKAPDAADVVIALIRKQLMVDPEKLDAKFAKHVVNIALGE